jgi:hypothetical protein
LVIPMLLSSFPLSNCGIQAIFSQDAQTLP